MVLAVIRHRRGSENDAAFEVAEKIWLVTFMHYEKAVREPGERNTPSSTPRR